MPANEIFPTPERIEILLDKDCHHHLWENGISHSDLTVNLHGIEWHCLLRAMNKEPLTMMGLEHLRHAIIKISQQLSQQLSA